MQESYHVVQLPLFALEKQCKKCPQNGLQDINKFPKDNRSKDGYYIYCKECVKEYYQANRESKLKQAKEYRENNKEYAREYKKEYRKKNKDKVREYNREYVNKNREAVKERKRNHYHRSEMYRQYCKTYIEVNRDSIKRKAHEHYLNNRDRILQRVASYRVSNYEKIKKYQRRWLIKNRDKVLASRHRRRGRKRVGGTFTSHQWTDLKKLYNHTCLCCGKKEPEIKLTVDHVIPLVRQGKNTIDNIQPLCLTCNLKKGTKSTDYR